MIPLYIYTDSMRTCTSIWAISRQKYEYSKAAGWGAPSHCEYIRCLICVYQLLYRSLRLKFALDNIAIVFNYGVELFAWLHLDSPKLNSDCMYERQSQMYLKCVIWLLTHMIYEVLKNQSSCYGSSIPGKAFLYFCMFINPQNIRFAFYLCINQDCFGFNRLLWGCDLWQNMRFWPVGHK